jgi:hypothetical protein
MSKDGVNPPRIEMDSNMRAQPNFIEAQ